MHCISLLVVRIAPSGRAGATGNRSPEVCSGNGRDRERRKTSYPKSDIGPAMMDAVVERGGSGELGGKGEERLEELSQSHFVLYFTLHYSKRLFH